MKRISRVLLALLCLGARSAHAATPAPRPEKFELNDGERVVFIGDTLIERDASHGYLETILTGHHPDREISFRNLGWSGDTVHGHARAGFGTPADGFQHLESHILALKPTVIFVGYGMTDSFDGEAGLSRFVEGMNRLLDVLAKTEARVVLISPVPHERSDLGPEFTDIADGHNQVLRIYRGAIEKVASERGHLYVDLSNLRGQSPYTDNGIHLNDLGFREFARSIANAVNGGDPDDRWHVALRRDGTVSSARKTKVGAIKAEGEALRFEATDLILPPPRNRVAPSPEGQAGVTTRTLQVSGLAPGRYSLKIDGKVVATADASGWEKGERLTAGPEFDQVEALREAIIAKNQLYFYRWRPQNETYLFGFRKHEQGNNAREVPEFDPLVAEQETLIGRLRVPVTHSYELVRESEVGR